MGDGGSRSKRYVARLSTWFVESDCGESTTTTPRHGCATRGPGIAIATSRMVAVPSRLSCTMCVSRGGIDDPGTLQSRQQLVPWDST